MPMAHILCPEENVFRGHDDQLVKVQHALNGAQLQGSTCSFVLCCQMLLQGGDPLLLCTPLRFPLLSFLCLQLQ